MIKNEFRKILNEYGLYSIEIYEKNSEELTIEYYCWYNMIISFHKTKNNKSFVKLEGDIPIALVEYVKKKHPKNKLIVNYPKTNNTENLKYCNNVLIKNILDFKEFLDESRNFWIGLEMVAKEMLEQEKTLALKN